MRHYLDPYQIASGVHDDRKQIASGGRSHNVFTFSAPTPAASEVQLLVCLTNVVLCHAQPRQAVHQEQSVGLECL